MRVHGIDYCERCGCSSTMRPPPGMDPRFAKAHGCSAPSKEWAAILVGRVRELEAALGLRQTPEKKPQHLPLDKWTKNLVERVKYLESKTAASGDVQ